MSRILVITTSLRAGSNSDRLAEEMIRGAEAAGHRVERISLKDKQIGFCRGCFVCQKTGKCVIRDDMPEIVEKMEQADVLVFATPIYYYEMSGQMKTLLDRGNPLFVSDYQFREVYLLCSAAEDEDFVPRRAKSGLEGWVECFPKAKLAGMVFGGGVTETGEMAAHHTKLDEAYALGTQI